MARLSKAEIARLQAERLALTEKIDRLELGFMSRSLAQIGLPHSNLHTDYFERTSGLITFSVQAHKNQGLPYGMYPRLLLAWICTEAVKTQNPVLHLGTNQTEFLKKLDLQNDGRYISALKEQSNRLLSSLFRLDFADKKIRGFKNLILASEGFEFWTPHAGAWETQFKLSQEFFEEVVKNPVPLDLNVLHAIRKSPLAMDVYTWLAYRTYLIYTQGGRAVNIRWEDLQAQFGANYGSDCLEMNLSPAELLKKQQQGLRNFKKFFLKACRMVTEHYPELHEVLQADSQFLTLGGAKLIQRQLSLFCSSP